MQVPGAAVVIATPDTVHTRGVSELNATGSPDDADADTVTGRPTFVPRGCANSMVCA